MDLSASAARQQLKAMFRTCEFYESYADYHDVMNRTEELLSGLVQHVCGTHETTYHTQSGKEYKINWARPWGRIKMIPALEEACGEKFPPSEELHTVETGEFLKRMLAKMGVECAPPQTNSRMIDKLVGEFIEDKCINPTFITVSLSLICAAQGLICLYRKLPQL